MDDFLSLAAYIQSLPYKRNSDKNDLEIVVKEKCGTCSSKHAFLKYSAEKQGLEGVELILGMFKMSEKNTKGVGKILKNAGTRLYSRSTQLP